MCLHMDSVCVCLCVYACVCVRMRACMHAFMHVYVCTNSQVKGKSG